MKEMKTLANCTDEEAIVQFNKIRHLVNEWCETVDIDAIRSRLPKLQDIPLDASEEQSEAIKKANSKLMREQASKNFNAILDAALETNPQLTLKVIRVCCFKDPDDKSLKFTDLIRAVNDIVSNAEIINFFIYTTNLGRSLGLRL